MAFFFSYRDVQDSPLRRIRSASAAGEKPSSHSTDREQPLLTDQRSRRKRSISSSSPTTESQEAAPPLPTPVSAGPSRGQSNTPSHTADKSRIGTSYDHSSTPIPFTKTTTRDSPTFPSKLMVDVPNVDGWTDPREPGPSSRGAVSQSLTDSRCRPVPASDEKNSRAFGSKLNTRWPVSPPDDQNQGWSTCSHPETSAKSSLLEPQNSQTRKLPCENSPTNLPTPISLTKGRSALYPDTSQVREPSLHTPSPNPARAIATSPTRSLGSAHGSAGSSMHRVRDRDDSKTTSEKSSTRGEPSIQPRERTRNVLRKPSLTRNRQPHSAPTSDTEKKTKGHRPRSNSVAVSPRHPNGAVFDVSQPLPTAALDLTPAGEVLAAYQESQRIARGKPGSVDSATVKPDIKMRQWNGAYSGEEQGNTTTVKLVTVPTKSLAKKTSATRNRGSDKRHEDSERLGILGIDINPKLSPGNANERRFVNSPAVNMHIGASPGGSQQPGWQSRGDEGREDSTGDWVGKPKLDSKDASSPGRLWRLVKKLSNGNLKERRTESSPPVPPLPTRTCAPEKVEDITTMPSGVVPETTGGFMRYITVVPTLSISRPKCVSHKKASHRRNGTDLGPTGSPPETNPSAAPRRWRSATTRSSSPSSGTTGFFSRSRNSSSSSYGEAVPPVPSVPAGACVDKRDREDPQDDAGKHYQTPRRKSPDSSSIVSVTIPRFDMQNPVNKFIPKGKRSLGPSTSPFPEDHNTAAGGPRAAAAEVVEKKKASSAPTTPQQQRSPRRLGGSRSISISTHASRKAFLSSIIPVQEAFQLTTTAQPRARPRAAANMQRDRPRSHSDGVTIIEEDTAKSTVRYREMTTASKQQQHHLTEQEKNEKWEDLLKRSDKAGGTLHVGSPTMGGLALWSDRSSMATSITLDQL